MFTTSIYTYLKKDSFLSYQEWGGRGIKRWIKWSSVNILLVYVLIDWLLLLFYIADHEVKIIIMGVMIMQLLIAFIFSIIFVGLYYPQPMIGNCDKYHFRDPEKKEKPSENWVIFEIHASHWVSILNFWTYRVWLNISRSFYRNVIIYHIPPFCRMCLTWWSGSYRVSCSFSPDHLSFHHSCWSSYPEVNMITPWTSESSNRNFPFHLINLKSSDNLTFIA